VIEYESWMREIRAIERLWLRELDTDFVKGILRGLRTAREIGTKLHKVDRRSNKCPGGKHLGACPCKKPLLKKGKKHEAI